MPRVAGVAVTFVCARVCRGWALAEMDMDPEQGHAAVPSLRLLNGAAGGAAAGPWEAQRVQVRCRCFVEFRPWG